MHILLEELFTLLFSGSITLFVISRQQRILARLLTATRQGKLPLLAAYTDYARTRDTALRGVRLLAVILVLLVFVLVLSVTLSLLGLTWDQVADISYIIEFTCVLTLGMTDVGLTIFVDREALSHCMHSSFSRRAIGTCKLKQACIEWVPLIIVVQGAILIAPLAIPTVPLALAVLGSISICTRLVYNVFFLQIHQASVPLNQTAFSYLLPRLQAWSHAAKVVLPDIQVTQDTQVGRSGLRLVGLRKPILYISMALLQYTEWRQQDALFAYVLNLIQAKMVPKLLFASIAIFLTLLLLLVMLYAFLMLQMFWTLPLMILCTLAIRSTGRAIVRLHLAADGRATAFTGDPAALLVALSTIDALNGRSRARRGSLLIPATHKRIDALLKGDWQRAPYATTPIPSIIAVHLHSQCVTTSFDHALEEVPSPVPKHFYQRLQS